jgi:diguanylate cyclase (GGDEF)-like protein
MIKKTDILSRLICKDKEPRKAITMEELTQFLNQSAFDRCLEREWERGRQEARPLSIILAQIDSTNGDLIDSITADRHIRQIREAMSVVVYRSPDLIYRCGGEEFGIILPHTSIESAIHSATQIRRSLKDSFQNYNSIAVNQPITMSYGLSGMIPKKEIMSAQILEAAEVALRKSKSKGTNCISVHSIEDTSSLFNAELSTKVS